MLGRDDLAGAIARLGFAPSDFYDDSIYPLLEQPLPWLCADRLDYFLRDGSACGVVTPEFVARCARLSASRRLEARSRQRRGGPRGRRPVRDDEQPVVGRARSRPTSTTSSPMRFARACGRASCSSTT